MKQMDNKFIPYSHQWIDDEDIEVVVNVLKSDWLTQGPKAAEFEKVLSDYTGARYAVVFSSGTAALHAAYFVAGAERDKGIIMSPITFVATANAASFLNANPVFVDIEEETGNINPDLITEAITKQTIAIVPVHYGGHPVDLEQISKIGRRYNLLIIEDAAHALGAEYKGKKIGNCEYSDMVIFSFHPVKSITTGEGGAVLTNNKKYYNLLKMFRHHGITKNKIEWSNPISEEWHYEMHFLGYNYRLSDIQSALGISQMKKLSKFIGKRRQIAKIYGEKFQNNDFFICPKEKDYAKSSWHLYPIKLKNHYQKKKSEIFAKLREKRLGVQVHYIPVYWQPYYQKLGYKRGICPKAEEFYQKEISIPLHQSMSDEQIKYTTKAILEVFHESK